MISLTSRQDPASKEDRLIKSYSIATTTSHTLGVVAYSYNSKYTLLTITDLKTVHIKKKKTVKKDSKSKKLI